MLYSTLQVLGPLSHLPSLLFCFCNNLLLGFGPLVLSTELCYAGCQCYPHRVSWLILIPIQFLPFSPSPRVPPFPSLSPLFSLSLTCFLPSLHLLNAPTAVPALVSLADSILLKCCLGEHCHFAISCCALITCPAWGNLLRLKWLWGPGWYMAPLVVCPWNLNS